jgi:hypothetical protein
MIEACRKGLAHFAQEYVYLIEGQNSFFIEEMRPLGAGKAFFSASSPFLVIKAKDNTPPVWAFKNRKCADGAFLTFDSDGCHLHILEMKSRLTQGEWAKAMLQLSGMYLTALASCRLLGVFEFKSVTCYIAFKEDAMSSNESADMIFMKTLVGQENPLGGVNEWTSNKIELPFRTMALIQKGQRDGAHNVHFEVV